MSRTNNSSNGELLPTPEMTRVVVEQSVDAIMVAEVDSLRFVYVNPAAERMIGLPAPEIIGTKLTNIHPKDKLPYVLDQFTRQSRGEFTLARDIPVVNSDGAVTLYDVQSVPVVIDGRKCLVGFFRDNTGRREAERRLSEEEDRFQLAIRSLPMGLHHYHLAKSNRLILVGTNPAAEEILGMSLAPHIGKCLGDIFPPLVETPIPDAYRDVARNGGVWADEQVVYKDEHIDGAFEVVAFQIRPGDAGVLFWDVTEKKKAEEDRRRVMAAIEGVGESVLISDVDHRILYVNPCFEKLTGYALAEVMGKHVSILKSGVHNAEFYARIRAELESGNAWSGTFVNRKKDGTLFHERATISPVKDDKGEIVNYVAIKRDVTRELDLERRVVRSQKMAALGQFAHRVAHDITNALTTMLGNAGLISAQTEDPTIEELVGEITGATDRLASLTTDLMAFASTTELSAKKLRLHRLIKRMSTVIERTCGRDIAVSYDLDEGICVNADASRLEQVIMHIVVNATEAIEGSGTLRICLRKGAMTTETSMNSEDGDVTTVSAALLEFTNDGPLLSEEECARAFEPFFSTKRDKRRNAGLGLATVYGIISRHNGDVAMISSEEKGTTVRISLPLAE